MRWDYLFNEQVLVQGKEYFQGGRVKNMIHRGGTYQATVTGSENHNVIVYLTDRVHPRLSCDCKDSYDGHCSHAAADRKSVV